MPWVREGECCRCGECCWGNPFVPEATDEPCPLLSAKGPDGKYLCTDRKHHYYLSGCNVWPEHPAQTADKPGCSYTWRWED